MEFKDEALAVILAKLSKKTGVVILYDEKLVNEKFSGNYSNLTMVEFLNRLFKKYNKAITFNREKKLVIVETFGAEKYIIAAGDEKRSQEILPFMNGITKAQLEELHREQYELYREGLMNKDELIPGLEINRGELEKLHEQQGEAYQADLNSPESVIPGTDGTTRGEIQKMQEQQMEAQRKSLEDPEVAVPGVEMSQGELRDLHERQYREYRESLNNPDEVIPGLDMTRKELEELHKKQMEENK
ncbi:MAG: hypothetical protein C4575_11060 [Desulforudis sp.]|nr:MAG: hypothetical protein C4575_11060 [Desulforudis sp.]